MATREWKTKADWIRDCEHKAQHVLARRWASEEELKPFRPRGRSAPLFTWLKYYGRLCGILGRSENAAASLEHSEADTIALAALRAEPARIELSTPPGADGIPTAVFVHRKSFDALRSFFHVRNWLLRWLTVRIEAIRELGKIEDAELLARAETELSYQTRLIAWAACTEGPGLLFGAMDERPEILEPWASLMGTDLLRINAAYMRVNAAELAALDRLVPAQRDSGEEATWSIFFGKLSWRMKVQVERLMKDYALAQLLAVVKLSAPSEAEAESAEELSEGAAA